MPTISPTALQELLTSETEHLVFDVRTPAEYAGTHIPKTENHPLERLNPKALHESGRLPKDQSVYLLCESGSRAAKAAEKFAKEGFDNSVIVEGGTRAWIAAGLPVNQGAVKVISLERQIRIAAGSLVLTGILLAVLVNHAFIVLSAFVGAGLVFAGVTDWCGLGLLLARAPWNRSKVSFRN
jgi:rhodanese-related sulfurtransferase